MGDRNVLLGTPTYGGVHSSEFMLRKEPGGLMWIMLLRITLLYEMFLLGNSMNLIRLVAHTHSFDLVFVQYVPSVRGAGY